MKKGILLERQDLALLEECISLLPPGAIGRMMRNCMDSEDKTALERLIQFNSEVLECWVRGETR